jgi:serine/threonine protein kinase
MEDFKNRKEHIPIEKIKSILFQLFTGLKYVHSKEIVHRDLKPENVLFTEDERIKICDFGSSKFIHEDTKSTPYIVSRYYRSPELILGAYSYNEKIDIFAAGCIMAELFSLTPLFPGKSEGLQIFEQMCVLGKPSAEFIRKFNLPQTYTGFFNDLEEIVPCDIKKALNKDKFYDDSDIRQAADLLFKLIAWDSNDRLSAEESLRHPFMKKF